MLPLPPGGAPRPRRRTLPRGAEWIAPFRKRAAVIAWQIG